ncbi:MAG: class I SAM-dependent methyltransferase [Marinifilaceae bacterium]
MQNNNKNTCPLCKSESNELINTNKRRFYQCQNCFAIFNDPDSRLTESEEKKHYSQHNNDVEDKGYQKFVSPITSAILQDFTTNDTGLDFGAGTGPVISKILKDNAFSIEQYDPFFHNYPHLLEKKYNYIACCEVIEHFHDPKKEFDLLRKLLHDNGKLYCMTDIYDESIDFEKWYYKNDPTHVFLYHRKTIQWIKEEYGFSDVTIEGRMIIFSL